MIFYVVLILPAASFIYTLIIFYRFKYFQEIDKKFIIKGDRINYIFTISNEDFLFYPYLHVTFFGSKTIFNEQFKKINLSLLPHKEMTYTFELYCRYSGNYEIGVEKIEIGDFLGIFKFTYKVPFPLSIIVYPRIIVLERFRLKTDFTSESYSSSLNRHEETGILEDVRKYAYGDTLKKVHWKLSAKLNEIMIKQFQSTTESSALIIPDFKKNDYTIEQNTVIEDKILESTIAVINYCLNNWIPISLICYSKETLEIKAGNPTDFSDVYNNVSQIRFAHTLRISDIADVYVKNATAKSNLILCTADIDYSLYNVIYYASLSGFNTIVIYISPEEITGIKNEVAEAIISDIPRIGAKVYKMNINDDIKTVLEVE
ncbi:MAG: DUF58 domain-containing protein [Clostridiaceae bacterium]|nr:DUF58 domain-containing protein [Clostridiaceae bacterium]